MNHFACPGFNATRFSRRHLLKVGGLGMLGIACLMWIPGLTALGMKAAWRGGLPAIGWKPARVRWWLTAYLLPPAVALVAYGAAWLTGLAPLEVPWERIAQKLVPGVTGLMLVVLLAGVFHFLTGCVFALGEEIGWRGLMVPLLVEAEIPQPLVVSGIIWGLWHLPLVIFGDYATSSVPLVSAGLFLLATMADGVTYGWMRLASRSLWPAVVLHASHNAYFQQLFDKLTGESAASKFIAGESGLFPVLVYGAVAVWIIRTGRAQRVIASSGPANAWNEVQVSA